MPTTLPSYTKTMDDAFMQTWYKIQKQAADNILLATNVTAWLRTKGCFKPQQGGNEIHRSVKYAVGPTKAVVKGDVLNTGETPSRTGARWTFRNLSSHVQRSFHDDRANRGEFQIVDYVADRLEDAMNGLKQQYEADFFRAHVTDESGKEIQGLFDLVPPAATRNTGTYGLIARPTTYASDVPTVGNTWWSPRYQQLQSNPEVNLLTDIKKFYNTVTNNQEAVDTMIGSKNLYELYMEWGLDQTQIVGSQSMLKLGFETCRYNGAEFFWTGYMTTDDILFLNTRHIEVVYDPYSFFEMLDWQWMPGQVERWAPILCTMNVISNQLRRHGRLYT